MKIFLSFLEFESKKRGQRRRGVGARSCAQAPTPRRRRRRGVGVRNCAPGGLRGVVRGKYNVLRAGADPGRLCCGTR